MSDAEEKQNAQSVDSSPQVSILYSAPGFAALYPNSVNATINPSNIIFNCGMKIARISREAVVKFGFHVALTESKKPRSCG